MEGQQRDGQRGQAPGTAWLEPVKGVYSPDTAAPQHIKSCVGCSKSRHLPSVFTDVSDQWVEEGRSCHKD
jgi:hypothetical protein